MFPRDGGPVGYRLGKDVVTEEFEAWKPIDEQMGYDERIRLLYVACTRACDHLVVSLHRADAGRARPRSGSSRTNAELLAARHGRRCSTTCPTWRARRSPLAVGPSSPPSAPALRTTWRAEREAALAGGGAPRRGGGHRPRPTRAPDTAPSSPRC